MVCHYHKNTLFHMCYIKKCTYPLLAQIYINFVCGKSSNMFTMWTGYFMATSPGGTFLTHWVLNDFSNSAFKDFVGAVRLFEGMPLGI